MTKHVQRGPVTGRTAHRAVPPTANRALPVGGRVSRVSLADLQDDTPAKNDTGVPKTPSEMSGLEPADVGPKGTTAPASDDSDDKEERGIIDMFDRLGE